MEEDELKQKEIDIDNSVSFDGDNMVSAMSLGKCVIFLWSQWRWCDFSNSLMVGGEIHDDYFNF